MPVNGIFKNAGAAAIGTSFVAVYTAPSSIDSIVIELDLCNIVASGIQCDVKVVKAGGPTEYFLLKDAPIPPGSTLQAISHQKLVLEGDDSVEVKSNTDDSIDALASIIEDVNN